MFQATTVTFLCPMRFDLYPLDSHVCKFRVGSTSLDITRMKFDETKISYDERKRNTILDYTLEIGQLSEKDRILIYGAMGNYSITGIEITFTRHKLKYLYVYYLPSGLFVVVSWASFLIPPEIVPGRMAMLITLFLVLTNIFNVSRYNIESTTTTFSPSFFLYININPKSTPGCQPQLHYSSGLITLDPDPPLT